MAQWVPKTAWRNHNLHHLYGTAAVGLNIGAAKPAAAAAAAAAAAVTPTRPEHSALRQLYRRGVPFLDLRDPADAARAPLAKATALHLHDIVSGAAREVLPEDKHNATIVVLAASPQRRVNGAAALRRLGYANVIQASADDVAALVAEA